MTEDSPMGIAGCLRRPGRRLAVAVMFWTGVAIALVWWPEPLVWLGVALGALLPVSVWIVWNRPHLYREAPRLEDFLAMTLRQFEEAVADLIVPLGYTDVRVVGGAAGLGVDVPCRDRKRRKVAIQVKRYSPGEPDRLIGGADVHGRDGRARG
ncbi:MAG TPA: restriction endonuclease [Thermomicrobiales bacterium]|nr:restriction endonuclease [Thermomicrobiales bacterium]